MIRCRWTGDALVPAGTYSLQAAREAMEIDDVVVVEIDHPRSDNSHRHQFAEIDDAWRHLPERLQAMPWAVSPDTLRKHALIVTGYRQTYSIDCGRDDAAERVQEALQKSEARAHGYAVASVLGPVVVVWTPESQSKRSMGGKRFQESKTAVLDWIAAQIGVTAAELGRTHT